jgi:hypothetical protein
MACRGTALLFYFLLRLYLHYKLCLWETLHADQLQGWHLLLTNMMVDRSISVTMIGCHYTGRFICTVLFRCEGHFKSNVEYACTDSGMMKPSDVCARWEPNFQAAPSVCLFPLYFCHVMGFKMEDENVSGSHKTKWSVLVHQDLNFMWLSNIWVSE